MEDSHEHQPLESPDRRRRPPEAPENYLNVAHGVLSWLLTKDHKRIAILYLVTVTVMFFIGGFAITIVRLNLMTPEGGLVDGRHLQPAVHAARRHHGVLLPGAGGARPCWATSACR